jgi:hypothetical protein
MNRYPSPVTACMKRGCFGIVLQDLPNLADCSVDAVVSIEEGAYSPDPLNNLLPADDLPSLLNQHRQNFRGNARQLKHTARAAQPIDVEIELEVLAKSDRPRNSDRL